MNGACILPFGPVSVSLLAGDRITIGIGLGKNFEPNSRARWAEWCAGGGTVLDVGAYTGPFAISAALLGCNVLAFEPMPFNANRMEANCKLNRVSLAVHRVAVSNQNGKAAITFNPGVPFTSGASMVPKKKNKTIIVKTITIDSLDLPQVTAIKIDVERGEPLVLAGARETLKRCRPKLLVESLGADEQSAILSAVPGYHLAEVIDTRNLVLLPN